MNVITVQERDLLHPRSKENLRGISLQNRFIQELYKNFDDCIVAGGAALNHYHGCAARDIDIFCVSEETAVKLMEFLDAERVSAAVGSTVETFEMGSANPIAGMYSNMNRSVRKFYGNTPSTSKFAFEVNVIVRAVPKDIAVLHRSQIYGLFLCTIPSKAYGFCFLDYRNSIYIAAPRGTDMLYVSLLGSEDPALTKLTRKLLLLGQATRGLTSRRIPRINTFRGEGKPIGSDLVFRRTLGILYHVDIVLVSLTKKGYVGDRSSQIRFTSLGGNIPDEYLRTFFEQDITLSALRSQIDAEIIEYLKGNDPKFREKPMFILRDEYSKLRESSSRSRSQDWTDTWRSTQTVQPSRGEDQVVFDEASSFRPSVTGVTSSLSELLRTRTVSTYSPFGTDTLRTGGGASTDFF